jgi:GT2 family glycosyltransferase
VGQHNPYRSYKYDWIGKVPELDHNAACGKNLLEFQHFHQPRICDYGYFPVLKRECLLKIGFVDDAYNHYFVDPDVGYSIQKFGWKNIYCPTSVFVHHHKSLNDLGQEGLRQKSLPDLGHFQKKWGLYSI